MWFQKISIPLTQKTLWFALLTPQDFPFQGVFDDPPTSRQEFPVFLNTDFLPPSEIQSGFSTFKKTKVNTNSVTKGRILLQQSKLL